jgi:hypothetical protein
MNPKRILDMLSELAMLKYFPTNNDSVLIGLSRLVAQMCSDESQVRWLIDRMTSGLYAEWPGPQEMRACFCSRFKPKDGINAYSTVYLDGIPLSKPLPRLPPPPVRAFLTGPEEPSLFAQDVAARKQRPKIAEVNLNFKRITQDDIDEALRRLREKGDQAL